MAAVDVSKLNWMTTKVDAALGWARKFSIFQYPFVTACCGMEYMATACSHYDVDRFGAAPCRARHRRNGSMSLGCDWSALRISHSTGSGA